MRIRKYPVDFGLLAEKAVIKLDVMLSPATAGQYLKYTEALSLLGIKLDYSVCLGFFEMGSFLARTWPGRLRPFEYFRCFHFGTWSLVFASIMVLSVMSTIKLKNHQFSYEFAWNYFNLLFQKSFQKFILKQNQNHLLFIWVLSSLFLSINFCVYLLDNMVRAQPTIKIDSLDQLANSKLKIIARTDSALAEFAHNSKDVELAQQLQPLLKLYDIYDSVEERTIGLRAGTHVYVNQRLVLMFAAIGMSRLEGIGLNLMEILHISKDDGGLEPYFIFVNHETDKSVLVKLNNV